MTDGIAEDLQNIRGTISTDGNRVSAVKGADGKMIGMDILGNIPPNTPIGDVPKAIFSLLDSVRKDAREGGIRIVRKSDVYTEIKNVHRKVVNRNAKDGKTLNIIVGGKISDSPGVPGDDGETVVVMEANLVANVPQKTPVTPIPARADKIAAPETVHDKEALAQFSTDILAQARSWSQGVIGEIKRKNSGDGNPDHNFIPNLEKILNDRQESDPDGQLALSVARGILNLGILPQYRRELAIRKDGGPVLEIIPPPNTTGNPFIHTYSVQFIGLLQKLPNWQVKLSRMSNFQEVFVASLSASDAYIQNVRSNSLRLANGRPNLDSVEIEGSSIGRVDIPQGQTLRAVDTDIGLVNLSGELKLYGRTRVVVNVDDSKVLENLHFAKTDANTLVLLIDSTDSISDTSNMQRGRGNASVVKTEKNNTVDNIIKTFGPNNKSTTSELLSEDMSDGQLRVVTINHTKYAIVPVHSLTERGVDRKTGYAFVSYDPIKKYNYTDNLQTKTDNMLRVVGFWDGKSEAPVQIEGKPVQFKPYKGFKNLWGFAG